VTAAVAATITPAHVAAPTGARERIDSIDALRGLVSVLMVVDHARDYSGGPGRLSDPMQLDAVSPLLFWMRWAAHFCAPVFTLLAGTSASLPLASGDLRDVRQHLLVRGAILVLLEFTVVHFSWTFSFVWPMFYAQVIWGLGVSLMVLALMAPLPRTARIAIGVLLVFGHNLLDGWHPASPDWLHWLWAILHDRQVMPLWDDMRVRTSYPVLPMIGLTLLGEALGAWYRRTPRDTRARSLALGGIGITLLFLLLRTSNLYGDPHPADYGGSWSEALYSTLNVTKYPMSLSFMLMTIGPALMLLAVWDTGVPTPARPLITLGRVPMFVYITHLYLLHALAIVWALMAGHAWQSFDFRASITGLPATFGFPLWVTLPFALFTACLIIPAARWYSRIRASRRYPVTRYL
jgi:uncharacterized membrane protein